MEKEQIVKALEFCTDDNSICLHCPVRGRCNDDSMFLEKEALSLIREQEKRIEELEAENVAFRDSSVDYREISYLLRDAKAEIVRKMHAEIKRRLLKGGIYPAFVACTIDNVAREMLEGGDNNDTE